MIAPELRPSLVARGWSAEVWDYCWLCPEPGFHQAVGGYEICLCVVHIEELEETTQDGYSTAAKPRGFYGRWWPWRLA